MKSDSDKLKILISALDQISTGEIKGEPHNYKDSLYICKEIAKSALEKVRDE